MIRPRQRYWIGTKQAGGAAAAGEEDGDRRDQGKGDECSEERMPGVRWKWKVPRDAGKAIVFYGKRERDQR